MSSLEYVKFSEVNPNDFITLLNNQKIRAHLIQHEIFTTDTVKTWVESKIKIDSTVGCRVRAIMFNNQLAGWCGIQLEAKKYEIAIVIEDRFWGLGRKVFSEIMRWAKKLGHEEIFIHLLQTRSEYKFLKNISTKVFESEIFGSKFTTYQLAVK